MSRVVLLAMALLALIGAGSSDGWSLLGAGSDGWSVTLPGRWVGAEKGDAVKDGRVVEGGARVRFVERQKGSRTPWNVSFLVPRAGHMTSETIAGGCGFYPSGTAFCRGYGVSEKGKAMETRVVIESLAENRVRFSVEGLLEPIEIRKD